MSLCWDNIVAHREKAYLQGLGLSRVLLPIDFGSENDICLACLLRTLVKSA